MIGENTIEIGTVDLCISSEVLGETSTDEGYSIESKLYEPVLGSFAPSDMPSDTLTDFPTRSPTTAPFFENYDGPGDKADGKNAQCTVTDDSGAVYSVDDSSGDSVAKYQYDVMIGENTIEIGTVDLCISSEVLGETSTDEVYSIESILYEPVLGSFAPSDMPSDAPTGFPTSLPTA